MKRAYTNDRQQQFHWLPQEIIQLIHSHIGCEVYMVRDLLSWHTTCKAFYNDWCDASYLYDLLVQAQTRGLRREEELHVLFDMRPVPRGRLYRQQTLLCGELILLDILILTVGIGRHVAGLLPQLPAFDKNLSSRFVRTFTHNTTTIASICLEYGDNRISLVENVLPLRLQTAFRKMASFLEQFYGWIVQFARNKKQYHQRLDPDFQRIEVDDDIRMNDVVWLHASPNIF